MSISLNPLDDSKSYHVSFKATYDNVTIEDIYSFAITNVGVSVAPGWVSYNDANVSVAPGWVSYNDTNGTVVT
ncbi:MAG: hypothetical protein MJ209_02215, partial [archaeon]|nr:hypothetical protein [archaeon]